MSLTPEAQKIIADAVIERLRRQRLATPAEPAASTAPIAGGLRIPVTIASAEDAQALAMLAARLARLEPYGDLLLQGHIRFDVVFRPNTASAGWPAAPAVQGRAAGAEKENTQGAPAAEARRIWDDAVLTEAALRRQPGGLREIELAPGAVVTPSARDHAKSRGIRIIRRTS